MAEKIIQRDFEKYPMNFNVNVAESANNLQADVCRYFILIVTPGDTRKYTIVFCGVFLQQQEGKIKLINDSLENESSHRKFNNQIIKFQPQMLVLHSDGPFQSKYRST